MSKVLLVSATKGNNYKLAQSLDKVCGEIALESEIISLEDFDLPLYGPAAEGAGLPSDAKKLATKLKQSRAVVWLAPEYNGSVPPIVNNAIAWVSRSSEDWREAFSAKVMVVGTHSGGGGHHVIQTLRDQLQFIGAIVLPRSILTTFQKALNPDSAKAILTQLRDFTKED